MKWIAGLSTNGRLRECVVYEQLMGVKVSPGSHLCTLLDHLRFTVSRERAWLRENS